MTLDEAAWSLGTSRRALYAVIDAGHLAAFQFGRRVRLREVDVEDYRRRRDAGE